MKKFSAVAAAAILFTTPALADNISAFAPPRESVSIRVSTNGLDLSRSEGMNGLRARVIKAVDQACVPGGVYQAYETVDPVCVAEFSGKVSVIVQKVAANWALKNKAIALR